MDINDLKYIVGGVKPDQPAIIRFFGAVNYNNTQRFNEEFLYLQDVVKPS